MNIFKEFCFRVKYLFEKIKGICLKHIWVSILAVGIIGVGCAFGAVLFSRSLIGTGDIRVIYSLDSRQNDREIIRLIDGADKFVYFAVYYFTQKDIAEALLRAKRRGLIVEGITDREGAKQSSNGSIVKLLQSGGIPVETQRHLDGIMHMKVLVTDKAYASGSYNWTQAATEANDEVLEIGTDGRIRGEYLAIVKRVLAANKSASNQGAGEIVKLDFTEAPKHIGEYAEVAGTVLKTYKSATGTVFLNFCKSSSKCPFSAVIFSSDAGKFKKLSDYVGAVTITGIIRSYRGSAEIIVSGPDQITVEK